MMKIWERSDLKVDKYIQFQMVNGISILQQVQELHKIKENGNPVHEAVDKAVSGYGYDVHNTIFERAANQW